MEEREGGNREMKKAIGIVRQIMIATLVMIFAFGIWIGSILQTSYRLSPVTAQEMEMEVLGK